MTKKLYKSTTDKKICGVLGGCAKYLNIDSTVLRALFAIFSVFSAGFPGIAIYIVLAFVLPEEPYKPQNGFNNGTNNEPSNGPNDGFGQ